ncbi:putative ABC transport system permease protein [Cohaesibacter marisflavi]|uniref:Putative ABC transport system permease protein n=1 Tax=Cohaesibacter marisflavi TaxID=655353 RepID=A0A1I5H8Z3_9HYPH|nr:FtsX-like permease family protein [Cohaesibacter marisflavi]SFO44301.1 putative ABC transport system permease protein [Cohaesibacter marisflavi]
MSPLDQKLTRDLWRIKGQAIAIAMVIATGVTLLVMMAGVINSLEETRRVYYERHRLGDVFAPVKRAPSHIIRKLAALPGISAAEGRITGSALISLPSLDLPLRAIAISLPDSGEPRLNAIHLTDGRRMDAKDADEIVLLNSFAHAHNLKPGDTLSATMNGAKRTLTIVGLAQSPEYLYSVAPGEMISDDSRFGVIWMSRTALAAAFDMQGAFNEAILSIGRSNNLQATLDRVDSILSPYGGLGSYGLKDLTSNRFVTEEIEGMRSSSRVVPPLFLAVAAFLLNIVISRMVEAEREQIGLIKAFGYTNREVGLHYFKFVLVIAIGGALLGCIGGIALGRAMMPLYLTYYKFPMLVFRLDPASFATAILTSIAAASAGGLLVLRKVFALTPAVAMRPPAPPDYSRTNRFGKRLNHLLDQPSRMVLRRITRQPGRMIGSLMGIACGMALSVSMISMLAGFDHTIDLTYTVMDRSDVTVTFTHPLGAKTIHELESIPGIIETEPERSIAVVFHNGVESYRGAITGLVPHPRLKRALDEKSAPITLPERGIILSRSLATELDIQPGEILNIDVLEGARPSLRVPVSGVAESLLGSPAYMQMDTLTRLLGEPGRISAVYLRIDKNRASAIFRALKSRPYVAGVSMKSDARAAFQKMMDTGAGSMRYIMLVIAAVITFGIVYNAARIAFAERQRDLASLRVMGFTRSEVSFVLLGELAVITLAALPIGSILGYYFTMVIAKGFSTDLYQIPILFIPESYGRAALAVLAASVFSGWIVRRDIDRADLVSALKIRE